MNYLSQFAANECVTHLLLEKRASETPDGVFYTIDDETVLFGSFNARANAMARNLQARGVAAGTHVAVLMETSTDYMLLWLALAKLGAVEIPINTAYRGDLLRHVLATARATVCVLDAQFAPVVEDAASGVDKFSHVFVRGLGGLVSCKVSDFATLAEAADNSNLDRSVRHDEITGIIFTSGTTGPSKGVMLSQHYLCAYGLMYAEINGLKHDDVIFNFLPFFHIAAKFLTIAALASGGRMRLQKRLSISTFMDDVREHGVTNFIGVGGICNMLLGRPLAPEDSRTTIRTIYAVPDPPEMHDEMERRFGCRITTVYGSTEVGLPLYRSVSDAYRAGSCGRPSPYYDVAIVDENDNPVPIGASGEIVVRPKRPYLIGSGYIGMPERTVEAWRNLWLHSGDRGRMDADGWFYFEDRLTDSIRRRGENISSYEVEVVVGKHPAVAEAIVVAAASEISEDEVWLLVIPRKDHAVSEQELMHFCAEKLPYFMVPRYISIVGEAPRTPTAKVEKYKLRKIGPKQAWDRQAQGWTVDRNGVRRSE